MAIFSMTGFARADGTSHGASWHWEIKSVNGKTLDMRLRVPPGYETLEQDLRERAAWHLRRGNLQANLQLSRDITAASIRVNEAALEQVAEIAERWRERLDGPPVAVEGLLALRGILEQAEADESDEQRDAREAAIVDSFEDACKQLAEMRELEGEKLQGIIAKQLDQIEALTAQARDCPARSTEAVKARLSEQVERLIDANNALDPDRLHQEAVLLATKSDVREEIDRLFAHVTAARELLAGSEPVGRKFDFLAQEFNREANTLCSKATDQALTQIGLELKSVIDQLREQVQNVE